MIKIEKEGKFDDDFDGIYWLMSVRSNDEMRQSLQCIKVDGGLMVCTDGFRIHLYTPKRDIPDGVYEIVTFTKKMIILNETDLEYPNYMRVFPTKTHNGIPNIRTYDKEKRDNAVANFVLKNAEHPYNIRYLCEMCPCDDWLSFEQFDRGILVHNESYTKGAILMAMRNLDEYTY